MDLRSHYPYWLMKNGIRNTYPSLDKDISVDVAIIGAGISGSLIAYCLCDAGLNVAIIDKRHPGMGSTAASTALLQYEIDTPLVTLSKTLGEAHAVKSYKACREALYILRERCKKIHPDGAFPIKPSLQYASSKKDRTTLLEEYKLRRKHGFDCSWMDADDIKTLYGFEAPGAILTAEAGEMDAFLMTYRLLDYCHRKGMQIYDNTLVNKFNTEKRHSFLETSSGSTIKARRVIMATGYEAVSYISRPVAKLYSTYALVSEPFSQEEFWYKNSLLWETAMPYMYFRATDDKRILLGGKDDPFYDPGRRDARISKKADQLMNAFHKKLPQYKLKADFCWAGTFAATEDGLPYIETIPEMRNTWFALGYGGNGIIFSVIAAEIIAHAIAGKKHGFANLFSFSR